MFYQIEKATNKIVARNCINNFGEMKSKYELKEFPAIIDIYPDKETLFPTTDTELRNVIRPERNRLLVESDKFALSDFPITQEQKTELTIYRQALRNLPETITLKNPVFPEKPNFI